MHFRYGKIAFRKRARLIQRNDFRFGKRVEIRGTFHQHALSRTGAEPAEIGKRHGNNQRARAGNDKEIERRARPARKIRKVARSPEHVYQRQQECHGKRGNTNDRRIVSRKFRDEFFALRLLRRGIFHQIEDALHGAVFIFFGDAHTEHAARVDAARKRLFARFQRSDFRFAR